MFGKNKRAGLRDGAAAAAFATAQGGEGGILPPGQPLVQPPTSFPPSAEINTRCIAAPPGGSCGRDAGREGAAELCPRVLRGPCAFLRMGVS